MAWTEAEGIVGGRPRTGCPADILVIVVGSAGQGDGGSLIAVDGWLCNNNPNTIQHTEIRTTLQETNVCLRGQRCHNPEISGITQIYSNYVHPALPLPPNANFIFVRFSHLVSCIRQRIPSCIAQARTHPAKNERRPQKGSRKYT